MVLTKKRTLWLSVLLGSLSAYGPLLVDMYLPAFPIMEADFHSSASMIQLSLTMCLAGLAIGPTSWVPGAIVLAVKSHS